jgi:hypothetical protein
VVTRATPNMLIQWLVRSTSMGRFESALMAYPRKIRASFYGRVYWRTILLFMLFVFGKDLPANSTDAGFQTQSADNLLEHHVLPAGACKNRMHIHLIRMLYVVAL